MSEILGVMFAALVGLIMLPGYMMYEAKGMSNVVKSATAQQMHKVNKAVDTYVKANVAAIQAGSTATTPYVITTDMLKSGGFLDSSFKNANPYGQTWVAEVIQPTLGYLQTMVYSQGGTPISETRVPWVAAQVGANGGFIPYPNQYGVANASSTARGAYDGWEVTLTTSGFSNPGSGHLASLLAFNQADLANSYLYRVKVPGHPELNAMQTDLSMTDQSGNKHNINGANVISTQSLDALKDGDINHPSVTMANGHVVTWNQVGEGGVLGLRGSNGQSVYVESLNGTFRLINSNYTSQLLTVDQSGNVVASGNVTTSGRVGTSGFSASSGYPTGWAGGVHTWDAYAEGSIGVGTNGSVAFSANNQGNVTVGSKLSLGTANGQANQGWGCSPNGSIAANANGSGTLMTCVNGTWQAPGVGHGEFRGYYVPPTYGYYGVTNPFTGWYSCPAGSVDYPIQVIWYGGYGYQWQHMCFTPLFCGKIAKMI